MNYREYWWKCTKEALDSLLSYLTVIGVFVLAVGFCALMVFLVMKYVEYCVPIFGKVVSVIIIVVTTFGIIFITLLIYNYRYYKKCVKVGVKE